MLLTATEALAARLIELDEAGSTNAELAALAAADPRLPPWTVVVTDHQSAGRGRLGRSWSAPPGTSLAISVLLRPRLDAEALGWIPLIAGAAMARSLAALGVDASLKWPNDVLIDDRKVCGILAETLPGRGVIVGAGLNHRIPAGAMPVPTATSLLAEGGPTDPDALIAGWLRELVALTGRLEASGDAEGSGVRAEVEVRLGTIGRGVKAEPPAGPPMLGTALGLDASGALLIGDGIGPVRRIAAGDITHLRYE